MKLYPLFPFLLLAGTPGLCPFLHGSNAPAEETACRNLVVSRLPGVFDSLPGAGQIRHRARYNMRLQTINPPHKMKGYLYKVGNSSLTVYVYTPGEDGVRLQPMTMPVSNLNYLSFHRKGKTIFGIMIGTGAGILLGHYLIKDPCKNNAGCITLAYPFRHFIGGLAGIVVGGIFGAIKTSIPIRGNQKNLEAQRASLNRYSVD